MTRDREDPVAALFLAAVDLPAAARAEFLARACGDDAALRAEVERLLAHDAGDWLDPTLFTASFVDLAHSVPANLGEYRLVRRLGEGGMGLVFEAEQQSPRRRVALKVMRETWPSPQACARFAREVATLARLQHPYIAQVFAAGVARTAGEERPYFVMELVAGVPLDSWLARADIDRRTRLTLFLRICEAVAHAHERGVVHRDLKPGNILVTDEGRPKVLDFGIARSSGDGEDGATALTVVGQAIGSLDYMSPEQIQGRRDAIDARTDVYALGVLLYQMLSGRLPHELRGRSFAAAVEIVARGDFIRLGTRDHALRGDLETIVHAALATEPHRRYASAAALRADVGRFLDGHPLAARPPSQVDRLRKFCVRHRGLVAAAGAVVVALAGGLVATAAALRTARAHERTAIERGADAKAALAKYELLQHMVRLDQAEAAAAELFPAWPENADKLRRWLAGEATPLLAALPELQRALADVQAQAIAREAVAVASDAAARGDDERQLRTWSAVAEQMGLEDRLGLEPRLQQLRQRLSARETEPPRRWQVHRFSSPTTQFFHDTLCQLVGRLEAFRAPTGLVERVRGDLAWTETLDRERLARSPDWQRAAAAVAADPRFAGLQLAPQVDLAPLGADPLSGLQEFAHLRSGSVPHRDLDGRLVLDDDFALVFVLVPGSTCIIDGQQADPAAPNYHAAAAPYQRTLRVDLAPFLLAKFEMTRAQWLRLCGGEDPSLTPVGTREKSGAIRTGRHPVDNVSYHECSTLLSRHGLALPTDAQWDRGARGGTATAWWTGAERASLRGAANLADQSARRSGAGWAALEDWPELDDGFAEAAPVDTLRPNPFGLHHVHGNLREWASPLYDYHNPVDAGVPSVRACGGDFMSAADEAGTAILVYLGRDHAEWTIGVRPGREIRATAR